MKVFVAMPLYDGKPEWQTALGWDIINRQPIDGVEFVPCKLKSFSAAKGRNLLVWKAQQEGCDRILFIDQDAVFNEHHLLRILSHDVDIVGGLYPHKDPKALRWVCQFETSHVEANGLTHAVEIGAGFLCVKLEAIATMQFAFHNHRFVSEDDQMRGESIWMLFRDSIVTADWNRNGKPWPRLLTEDFYFCYIARQCGFTVWADTLCQIGHVGVIDYLEMHAAKEKI